MVEVYVSVVAQTEAVVAQTYYNGTKESERPSIASLLTDKGLLDKKIVLDAPYLVPTPKEAIHNYHKSLSEQVNAQVNAPYT